MPAEPTPTRVRRRATEACTFCRKRKVRPTYPSYPSSSLTPVSPKLIKCNGQKPKCINCQTYEKDCVYEPVPDVTKAAGRQRHQRTKTRSVKARTESPARQTSAPAASSNGDSSEAPSSTQQAVATRDGAAAQPRHQSWDPSPRPMDSGVARVVVLANGESTYHGRTSALFEDNAQERPVEQEVQPRMPDHWVERGLIAEAAKQRQLEEIHFAKGQLDFDGVDPDLGMHLLSLHWNRQHHSFLITYRPAFMRDMACGGPYFSKLLLNAIYFGSSKFSPRLEVRKDVNDVRTAGWRYRERVRELVGGSLDRSDITTIQALLVMTNSLFALGDERSAAWLYTGLAFRMLIDLGLHVDLTNSHQFSDEDLEIRRRVFWGAFVVDKIQSLYQGRPVTLKENDAVVPIKFIDTYSELEFWQPFAYSTSKNNYAGSPAYSISTFTALCKLSIVMSDVMSTIYTVRTTDQSPAELSKVLDKLQKQLRDWHAALPGHLKPEVANVPDATVPPPHILSLHAMYHVLVILLHRPFVADGHLYNTFRSISVDSVIKCSAAASSICSLLRAYHRAFSVRRAPCLISYATYVAATIHCRIAAKNGKGSAAYVNLMTCLAVFKENQETNSAVQKASVIIHRLMRKYGVVVDDLPDDALEAEPATKSRDQQPQQQQQQQRVQAQIGLENTGSAQTETSPNQEMQPVELNGSAVPSPGSDWINIDGIIQSFLRKGDFNAGGSEPTMYGQYPQKIPQVDEEHYLHTSTGQQPVYLPQGFRFPAGGLNSFAAAPVPGAGDIEGGNSWQQTSFWPANQDAAFLEDPIFGFNGSSTGGFQFMGR
ncbi:pathway-specific regulatory nit-4 [Fusarium agapanthi]|uniref:Pathway-specific regulatory nit-4 n=1 Tax=Fusarium agapanthi TaxID=1803897 RepID=A0A9P5BJB2_9HYPO|nr:pathway-specific regulatory nit-4 [Fusarium agapanthi]